MLRIVLVATLVAICHAKCRAPKYGSIDKEGRNAQYSCDEGFVLMGLHSTVCSIKARSKNVLRTACFPIYFGEGNCSAIDACPNDLKYLRKFVFSEEPAETDKLQLKKMEADYLSDSISRSGGTRTMCKTACNYGYQVCFRYKQAKKRNLAKKCMKCFKNNNCGVQFWG